MARIPLRLQPGMTRPGTVYEAKGRWYDGTLVRWFEGVMQAVGGWETVDRTNAPVSAAIADDGGVFTDETTDANDPGAGDVTAYTASRQVGDAFYVGEADRFTEVQFNTSQVTTDGALTWEYWNGSTWAALAGVVDGTNSFLVSGVQSLTFDMPSDWETTTVNSQGPFFYVRGRVTTIGTGVSVLLTQVWVGPGAAPDANGTSVLALDEVVRGVHVYRRSAAAAPQTVFGTPTKLWRFVQGVLTEITPSTFDAGAADAVQDSGTFGQGPFGVGAYGVGDPTQDVLTEANTWQLDNYGEDLVAVAHADGQLLYFDTSVGGLAAALTNAPTNNLGVVVTPERFVVALGAGGEPKLIQWADQEDITVWAAGITNQAGDLDLSTEGQIMAGRRTRSGTLIWTDVGLHNMRFIGGSLVYTAPEVGKGGAISRRSMAVVDQVAFWMGPRGFYVYDGAVRRLASGVGDYVFSNLNRTQASKVWCDSRTQYSEVTWFYPSSNSMECDSYVTYNYLTDIWYFGLLTRTSGADQGVLPFPLAVDSLGVVYQHESGDSYLDEDQVTSLVPYAASGPIEVGSGDNLMFLDDIYPDEATLGDLRFRVYTADEAVGAEVTNGPYPATEVINLRLLARQMRIEIEQVNPGWRFGVPRLDVTVAGER